MLSRTDIQKLRSEIVLNSIFLKDYSNSLGISEKKCCDFFNSYIEYIAGLRDEKEGFKLNDIDAFNDLLNNYDNIENLYDYYIYFEKDPLPITDDIIKDLFIKYADKHKEIDLYSDYNDFDNIEYTLYKVTTDKSGYKHKTYMNRCDFEDEIIEGYRDYADNEIDNYINDFLRYIKSLKLLDEYALDYIDRNIDYIKCDFLRDMVYDHVFINYPIADYMKQEIKVNLFIQKDFLTYVLHSNGYFIKDFRYLRKLLNNENLTSKDLKQLEKDRKENNFISSIIEEIENAYIDGYNEFCVIAKITIEDYFNMLEEEKDITIKKDCVCGLVDRFNGGGSILEIQLEKDIKINTKDIVLYVEKVNSYTVDEIYGLTSQCFKDCVVIR